MARVGKQGKVLESPGEDTGSSSEKTNLIEIPSTLSVKQLANLLQVSGIDIIDIQCRKSLQH